MSWHAVSWAKAQRTGSPSAKVTLLVLAEYTNADGECWPSRETIAEDTEQSVDTVDRRLRELEEIGLITKLKRRVGQRQGTSIYRLNFDPVRQKKHLQDNILLPASEPQDAALASEPQSAAARAANDPVSEPQNGPSQGRTGAALTAKNLQEPSNEPETHPNPPDGREQARILISEGEGDRKALRKGCEAIAGAKVSDAHGTHAAVRSALDDDGWRTETEVGVPDRGDGRPGRIDLSAEKGGVALAIEIDRETMRAKSITKLRSARGFRVGVLRESSERAVPPGLDALVVLTPRAAPKDPVPAEFIEEGTPEWFAWEAHRGPKPAVSRLNGVPGRYERTRWPPRATPPPSAEEARGARGSPGDGAAVHP